jgi:CobQ-like glutamine amidotransferase family enzyme
LTDYLIKVALEIKYKERIELKEIDNSLEQKARLAIAKRLSVGI